MKIGFLGAGHLGRSIIDGLLNTKQYQKADFRIVVASGSSLAKYQQEGFQVSTDWATLAECEVVVLALRPDVVRSLQEKFLETFSKQQIIISVVTGVSLAQLKVMFPQAFLTRVMPNTACQFNQSMTMITTEGDKQANIIAQEIFNLLGKTVLLNEDKIHVFIAICGSAIAYLYYWLDPLMKLALDSSIDLNDSKAILANLLVGASANIAHSTASLKELQQQVSVPGGTTIEAISIFDQNQLQETIAAAIQVVVKKSEELS